MSDFTNGGNGNILKYRVDVLERDLEFLQNEYREHVIESVKAAEELRKEIVILREKIESLEGMASRRLQNVEGGLKGNTRALVAFAFTFAAAAAAFGVAALRVFGAPG